MAYLQMEPEIHVKKKVEEGLRSKMKQKALAQCGYYTSKYNECATGKTLSYMWQCREQVKKLNNCLHNYTHIGILEDMKREYALNEEGKGPARP